MKLDSFKAIRVQEIVEARGWESTIINIPRFITKVVRELYAKQLKNMEEMMYFVLLILKHISLSDPPDPSVPVGPSKPVAQGVAIGTQ